MGKKRKSNGMPAFAGMTAAVVCAASIIASHSGPFSFLVGKTPNYCDLYTAKDPGKTKKRRWKFSNGAFDLDKVAFTS